MGLEEKPFTGTGKRRKKEIWVLGLEEEGHGWFGRERFWVWKRKRLQEQQKEGRRKKRKFSFNAVCLECQIGQMSKF